MNIYVTINRKPVSMYPPAHAITPHMTRFIYAFRSPRTSLFSFNQAALLNWGRYCQVPAHLTAETQSPPEALGAAALVLVSPPEPSSLCHTQGWGAGSFRCQGRRKVTSPFTLSSILICSQRRGEEGRLRWDPEPHRPSDFS